MKNAFKSEERLLTVNPYSRPGRLLKGMRGIVVHWVANPGSSAMGNRNFFESRKSGKHGYGSAHEIIDINGSRVVCISETELAYHVGSKKYTKEAVKRLSSYPNNHTYGIEMCHKDWTGQFSQATLESAAKRCAELCIKYDLDPMEDIWTHYGVVGWKDCPRWFVNHPEDFEKFKELVREMMYMAKLEGWQVNAGRDAVKKLAAVGILNDPDRWSKEEELAKPAPTWLVLTLMARVEEEANEE